MLGDHPQFSILAAPALASRVFEEVSPAPLPELELTAVNGTAKIVTEINNMPIKTLRLKRFFVDVRAVAVFMINLLTFGKITPLTIQAVEERMGEYILRGPQGALSFSWSNQGSQTLETLRRLTS